MAETLTLEQVAEFVDYYQSLPPSEKCTVHPPSGSEGSALGIYNRPTLSILVQWVRKNVPDYCDCIIPIPDQEDIDICGMCGNKILE